MLADGIVRGASVSVRRWTWSRRNLLRTCRWLSQTATAAENSSEGLKPFVSLLGQRLSAHLQDKCGIHQLMPIQSATLEPILNGKDLLARARTGTGKTLAFLLPLLVRCDRRADARFLILSPTRELARQTAEASNRFAPWVSVAVCHGGASYQPQVESLKRGASMIIGTPGRVWDLMEQGSFPVDAIECVCLDEADHMLDIGFATEMERILDRMKKVSQDRVLQTLLFSATVPRWVDKVCRETLRPDFERIDLIGQSATQAAEGITYRVIPCVRDTMRSVLVDVIRLRTLPSALGDGPSGVRREKLIVFCDTKSACDETAKDLHAIGIRAAALHGDLSQAFRQQTLQAFHSSKVECLVATDVAARGLDISGVDCVIQMGCPGKAEPFLHRRQVHRVVCMVFFYSVARLSPEEGSGRTGRNGKEGLCLILCDVREDLPVLQSIGRQARVQFTYESAPRSEDLLKACMKSIIQTQLPAVPEPVRRLARSFTGDILKSMEGEDAIASLLALLTNLGRGDETNTGQSSDADPLDRSMLTGRQGYTTMQLSVRDRNGQGNASQFLKWLNAQLPRGAEIIQWPIWKLPGQPDWLVDVPSSARHSLMQGCGSTLDARELSVLPALHSLIMHDQTTMTPDRYRNGNRNRSGGRQDHYRPSGHSHASYSRSFDARSFGSKRHTEGSGSGSGDRDRPYRQDRNSGDDKKSFKKLNKW